jgi:hypothetical protein
MVPTPMYGMRPSYAPVSVYTAPPTQPPQPTHPPQLSEQELKQASKAVYLTIILCLYVPRNFSHGCYAFFA